MWKLMDTFFSFRVQILYLEQLKCNKSALLKAYKSLDHYLFINSPQFGFLELQKSVGSTPLP